MEDQDFQAQVASISALAEPTRLALYRYVAGSAEPVSREQAAAGVDVAVHSAKFHLDRLVEEGLLEVEFRRLTGRTGPGAGRPSKLYRRASRHVAISLPERRYDLASDVLATAVDQSARDGTPIAEAVQLVAHAAGERIASDRAVAPRSDPATGTSSLVETLAQHGYEPRLVGDDVTLTNCPFDRLAAEHAELVCGMNLALVAGVIHALGSPLLNARLEPQPGFCCVKVAVLPGS